MSPTSTRERRLENTTNPRRRADSHRSRLNLAVVDRYQTPQGRSLKSGSDLDCGLSVSPGRQHVPQSLCCPNDQRGHSLV